MVLFFEAEPGITSGSKADVVYPHNGGGNFVFADGHAGYMSYAPDQSDGVLYTYAGPEIAVASTKAYTTQLMTLYLVALYFAKVKGTITNEYFAELRDALWELPKQTELILDDTVALKKAAARYYCFNGFLYMGRGINLASALEGALKIKEISYMHAEGYAAGEMKHGPIAMIDRSKPA